VGAFPATAPPRDFRASRLAPDDKLAVMDASPARRRLAESLALAACTAFAFVACSPDGGGSPLAARGRQVYVAQCTSCHALSPAEAGPVGPSLKGSSRDVLEAKLLRGTYPPGYTPKRPTQVMPVQPQSANDIDALAEFLK
jgi:mono/diheme cytochrome c family protein